MRGVVKFNIEGATRSYTVQSLMIDTMDNSHEMMTVELSDRKINFDDIKSGTRVSASITAGGIARPFVGYIHHVRAEEDPVTKPTTIICIGATYLLKEAHQRVWSNMTATAIAALVCQDYRLSYNIVPHPRVFPQMSQSGMSDWKFLVYLADKIGYNLHPEGASVHMAPRLQSWEEGSKKALVFNLKKQGTFQSGALIEFEGIVGENMPTAGGIPANPTTIGVDPRNLELIGSKADKKKSTKRISLDTPFNMINKDHAADSLLEGEYESQAYRERTRYPIKAQARVVGFPSLGPTSPVYLNGIGPTYSGYWIVSRARHIVDRHGYECILDLCTDSLGNDLEPPTQNIVSISPNEVRVSPVTNTLINEQPQLIPGASVPFSDVSKWAGAQSDLRITTPLTEPVSSLLFNKMLVTRGNYGL